MDLSKIYAKSILLRSTHYALSLPQLSAQQKTTTKQKKKQEKKYWEKVGVDIFKNCNQKCQEGVSSKTHYQGMDIRSL